MSAADSGRLDPQALAAMNKAERIAALRDKIAAVPGRIGAETATPPTEPESQTRNVLPVPGALGDLLPGGGLTHGEMAVWPRGSLLCGLLAAATGAGITTAVLGGQRLGLLAAWEMGAHLDRLFNIEVEPDRVVEVAAVLADGIRLLVIDVPGELRIAPRQVENLRARLRSKGTVLVVTGGQWIRQPHLDMEVRKLRYDGIGQGHGRLRSLEVDVDVRLRGRDYRRGRLALTSTGSGRMCWSTNHAPAAAGRLGLVRTG
ncbi:hypothetical protein [Nocardia sp. NBC_00511]|uniref:hypothetical protein n=1 Tax=Nocardia sp. NBC_00511 TaxID=2903591 RepID=UPI002F9096BD